MSGQHDGALNARTFVKLNPSEAVTSPALDAEVAALLSHPHAPITVARKMKKSVGWVWWRIAELELKVPG